jgi:hypothetical protein
VSDLNELNKDKQEFFISGSDVSSFQFRLVQLSLFVFVLLAVPIGAYTLLRHFYFNEEWLGVLSFISNDPPGFVKIDPNIHAFGIHYFGDYLLSSEWSMSKNPWLEEYPVNYPPLAILFFRMFTVLEYTLGLIAFQLIMFISMIAPIWMSLQKRSQFIRLICTLIFGLGSAPIIIAIDRGNIVGFLGLLLYLFASSVFAQRWYLASVFVAIAVGIKLFPIVLFSIFLIYGKWRPLLVGLSASLLTVLGALRLFPGSYSDSLAGFWTGFSAFRDVDPNLLYCGNQSLIGGLLSLLDRFEISWLANFVVGYPLVFGLLFSSLTFLLMAMYRDQIWLVLVLALSLLTASPSLVYGYTMIWAVAALAIIFFAAEMNRHLTQSLVISDVLINLKRLYFTSAIYVTILLVPFPIEWQQNSGLECTSSFYPAVYFVSTSTWFLYLFIVKYKKKTAV